ncbi:MAG: orotidine-5'-phosphate decarboxylase [Nocardioidaceae bacterium]|nr:orotidine-5'-phosphate decarboxylase [Nocardioidaceae bacterium]
MTDTFGQRLRDALVERGPLCVGVDPHAELLGQWGLPDDATGLERFAQTVVEAVAGEVAAVKPQLAFFERHGAAGIAVLERTVAAAGAAGALVVLDAKRGDIGSTAAAYADAYLRPGAPLAADAVTVNPYLGFETLRPFLTLARDGVGVFVVALTSNPEGASVQRARAASGRSVAADVCSNVAAENAGTAPYGSVGVVVGAGQTGFGHGLDQAAGESLAVGGPLLVPGLGAQGGRADDVRRLCTGLREPVLPSVSRSVLAAGPDAAALRSAALRHRDDLLAVMPGG